MVDFALHQGQVQTDKEAVVDGGGGKKFRSRFTQRVGLIALLPLGVPKAVAVKTAEAEAQLGGCSDGL